MHDSITSQSQRDLKFHKHQFSFNLLHAHSKSNLKLALDKHFDISKLNVCIFNKRFYNFELYLSRIKLKMKPPKLYSLLGFGEQKSKYLK